MKGCHNERCHNEVIYKGWFAMRTFRNEEVSFQASFQIELRSQFGLTACGFANPLTIARA